MADKLRARVVSDLLDWLAEDSDAERIVQQHGMPGAIAEVRRWWLGYPHTEALRELLVPYLHTEPSQAERRALVLLREWVSLHAETQRILDEEARREDDPWKSAAHQEAHRRERMKRDELFDAVSDLL